MVRVWFCFEALCHLNPGLSRLVHTVLQEFCLSGPCVRAIYSSVTAVVTEMRGWVGTSFSHLQPLEGTESCHSAPLCPMTQASACAFRNVTLLFGGRGY